MIPGGSDGRGLLLQSPRHLHRAVVAQKAADLPGNFRHRVGGKLGSVRRIKALHRFQESQTTELVQVVRLRAPTEKAPGDRPDQPGVFRDQRFGGLPAARL